MKAGLSQKAGLEQPQSLLGELNRQLRQTPNRIAFSAVSYEKGTLQTAPLSITELAKRTHSVAKALRTKGFPKHSRILLSTTDPHAFLSSFLGIIQSDLVPVPLPPWGETRSKRQFIERLTTIANDCSPAAALVSVPQDVTKTLFSPTLPTFCPRRLQKEIIPPWSTLRFQDKDPDDVAFIQYTSGSTSNPKGVVVTHGNLIANCKAIAAACGFVPNDCGVSWLPLHHDMGLIGGVLTALFSEVNLYLLAPSLFLSKPISWLRALDTFKGTISLAPTFAYRLCANQLPGKQLKGLDLSHWRIALVGAEPVDAQTLQAFADRFSAYGFCPTALTPVYGLAESTLAATFSDITTPFLTEIVSRTTLRNRGKAESTNSQSPDSRVMVSVGRPVDNLEVMINDLDTGSPVPERHLGEIVVRGPSVTPRYYGEEGKRTWLQTGDVGYMVGGQLYVCDRIKDLLIIGGQNYHPSDIELVVSSVPGIRKGRIVAFAGTGMGAEKLHIAAEVQAQFMKSKDKVISAIRQVVAAHQGLPVETVKLLPSGSLPRTSSGKIQRRLCASLYGPHEFYRISGAQRHVINTIRLDWATR